ncbi:MAG: hypothetical protein ACRDRF_00655 [Pseudonocardiaceae bacterium]
MKRGAMPQKRTALSDKSKLAWERYYGPMQSAAAAFNAAIKNTENIVAAAILEAEGLSPETHFFDMNALEAVERPNAKGKGK